MCWLDACVCFLSETVRKQASLASLLLQLLSTLLGVAAGGAGCYLRFARPEIEGLLSGFVFLHYPTLLIAHGVVINLFNLLTFKFLVAVMDWRQLHRNRNLCRLYPNLLLILRFLYLLFLALVALCTIHHGTALKLCGRI